mmetsp:Transcript_14541/g.35302  ORF Transcript_14541/g.35302 Transcript_14541/m.35302 type:complete len:213 (+) Transcript_14541:234-872(+)
MMSGSFSPPDSTKDVPGSSSQSQSHPASSSPYGAGEHQHQQQHQQQLQGSRRRQRGPRVRTTSDLSAMMMMSKAPENPTIDDAALAEGVGGMTLSSSSSRSNASSVLSRDGGLNGRTCTTGAAGRSSQATVKHTTVSTEDFGRIASPALQLRRMKRRLLLEAVGQTYSNCDSIRNGGGSSSSRRYFNNAHNMIDRQDSDISSSSTLTSVGDE